MIIFLIDCARFFNPSFDHFVVLAKSKAQYNFTEQERTGGSTHLAGLNCITPRWRMFNW